MARLRKSESDSPAPKASKSSGLDKLEKALSLKSSTRPMTVANVPEGKTARYLVPHALGERYTALRLMLESLGFEKYEPAPGDLSEPFVPNVAGAEIYLHDAEADAVLHSHREAIAAEREAALSPKTVERDLDARITRILENRMR